MNRFPLHPILAVAAMNLFLIVLMILISCSSMSRPAGFEIRMPRAVVSEGLQGDHTILITAENVLYFNNKVVTYSELKRSLTKIDFKHQNIFIQISRRASTGRVMDVWDLCRALGSAHVHVIALQEN